MNIHYLKILPEYFERVLDKSKTFEIRKNDRDYKVGDTLILQEYVPNSTDKTHANGYTGREIEKMITYILNGGSYGLEEGYVVLSIK